MAASSLPLLQLPSETIMKVLKSMDTVDQIAISLVSKATKSLIISINIEGRYSRIMIDNTLTLLIRSRNCFLKWHFVYEDPETIQPVKLQMIDDGNNWRQITYEWKKDGFGVKNWIEHLAKVTNIVNIDNIFVCVEGEQVDMCSLKEMIHGLNIKNLVLHPEGSNDFAQSILKTVKTRMLIIRHNPYEDKESFQKNLMENFEAIDFPKRADLTLNDLLATNSSVILINTPRNITIQVLNRFIKCWKAGSNRQLKYMTIGFQDSDVPPHIDDILRGIKHTKYHQKREFELPEATHINKGFMLEVNGGYDICTFDGRKSTISIELQSLVHMFVWPF